MFGWLKSLFGSEPEAERIVPPPLPSKVKKAERLVGKKVAKKAVVKKEATKEAPKAKTVSSAKKKKEVATESTVKVIPVEVEIQSVEKVTPKRRSNRQKKD